MNMKRRIFTFSLLLIFAIIVSNISFAQTTLTVNNVKNFNEEYFIIEKLNAAETIDFGENDLPADNLTEAHYKITLMEDGVRIKNVAYYNEEGKLTQATSHMEFKNKGEGGDQQAIPFVTTPVHPYYFIFYTYDMQTNQLKEKQLKDKNGEILIKYVYKYKEINGENYVSSIEKWGPTLYRVANEKLNWEIKETVKLIYDENAALIAYGLEDSKSMPVFRYYYDFEGNGYSRYERYYKGELKFYVNVMQEKNELYNSDDTLLEIINKDQQVPVAPGAETTEE